MTMKMFRKGTKEPPEKNLLLAIPASRRGRAIAAQS